MLVILPRLLFWAWQEVRNSSCKLLHNPTEHCNINEASIDLISPFKFTSALHLDIGSKFSKNIDFNSSDASIEFIIPFKFTSVVNISNFHRDTFPRTNFNRKTFLVLLEILNKAIQYLLQY